MPWEFMAKGLDFGLGLWKLHTMSSRSLQFLYLIGSIFLAHFFGLSTKFDHSIPRPLNFDGHSAKRPLVSQGLSHIYIYIYTYIGGLWFAWKIAIINCFVQGKLHVRAQQTGPAVVSKPWWLQFNNIFINLLGTLIREEARQGKAPMTDHVREFVPNLEKYKVAQIIIILLLFFCVLRLKLGGS
jgi:hypothetical protein